MRATNQKQIWLIEINGEWWIKFKKLSGRWTKNKALATPVTTMEMRIYRKDWVSDGVRIRRAPR